MDTQVLTNEKIIEELNEVLQVDIDAVGSYHSAIKAISEVPVKQQLEQFKADHERHIVDLRAIVKRIGGKPKSSPDIEGALRRGFTALAGLAGAEAVLKAMQNNERRLNEVYSHHVQKLFPPDILDVLRRNYGDEQRHYAWIQSAIQQRLWEQTAHPAT